MKSPAHFICSFILFVLFILFSPPVPAHSSSPQAYQDYLFQFDRYRSALNEFTIAKNEYQKFQSLASETVALEKAKTMLTSRAGLLRSYLLLLNEKLNENTGITDSQRSLYQSLIANEVAFLFHHSQLLPSVGTLPDSQKVSQQLASHYDLLQATMYQTIVNLTLGDLAVAAGRYDQVSGASQTLVNANRQSFTPAKLATMDRWLLQIANKKSLYQQKVEAIRKQAGQLQGNTNDLNRSLTTLRAQTLEAKQYLTEGSSFITELVTALKYTE